MTFVFGGADITAGYGNLKAYYEHYRTGGKGFGLTPIETRPCTNDDFLFPDEEEDASLL
jgi:hypothetical protein